MQVSVCFKRSLRATLVLALLAGLGLHAHAVSAKVKSSWEKMPETTPTLEQVSKQVQAKAALLVDANTGEILFARNTKDRLPPASTVKIMTSMLAMERLGGLKGEFEVIKADQAEPSNVPLRPGEKVKVYDMVRSVIMGSDNDSAKALGRYAGGGTLDDFITLMNQRAQQLGATRTVYKTPNGLPAKGQYTTCEDLLKVFQKFLTYPELREFARTKGFTLKTAVGEKWVKNHNKLLGVYPGMDAAKTGWTYASRHTYAASIVRDGHELHLIILNSPNKWKDSKALLDYAFSLYGDRARERNRAIAGAGIASAAPVGPIGPAAAAIAARAIAIEEAPRPLSPAARSGTKVANNARTAPTVRTQGDEDSPTPRMKLSPAPVPVAVPATAVGAEYTIRPGDSLYKIAKGQRCTVQDIMAVNPEIKDPAKIWPGQKIKLPKQ